MQTALIRDNGLMGGFFFLHDSAPATDLRNNELQIPPKRKNAPRTGFLLFILPIVSHADSALLFRCVMLMYDVGNMYFKCHLSAVSKP